MVGILVIFDLLRMKTFTHGNPVILREFESRLSFFQVKMANLMRVLGDEVGGPGGWGG